MEPDLSRAMGRLEGKVDAVLTAQQIHAEAAAARELRISALEKWRSYLVGAWAALAVLSGAGVFAIARELVQ